MFRGMTIEELISSVERAEQHAHYGHQEQQATPVEVQQGSYYRVEPQAYPEVA
jgi:hypothetical protein